MRLDRKIVFGVVETDVFNHRAEQIHVRRDFSVLDISPDEITENAAEIFVTRIRKKTAAG